MDGDISCVVTKPSLKSIEIPNVSCLFYSSQNVVPSEFKIPFAIPSAIVTLQHDPSNENASLVSVGGDSE